MSSEWARKVQEFHEANGYPPPLKPTAWLKPEIIALRQHLMMEELGDVSRALNDRHLVNLADGICDLLYTVVGTAIEAGLGPILHLLFEEVHRSNMTKTFSKFHDGHRGAIKGPNFDPPHLEEILRHYSDAVKKVSDLPCCPGFMEGGAHSPGCHKME